MSVHESTWVCVYEIVAKRVSVGEPKGVREIKRVKRRRFSKRVRYRGRNRWTESKKEKGR